jgi:hypothetical protein
VCVFSAAYNVRGEPFTELKHVKQLTKARVVTRTKFVESAVHRTKAHVKHLTKSQPYSVGWPALVNSVLYRRLENISYYYFGVSYFGICFSAMACFSLAHVLVL